MSLFCCVRLLPHHSFGGCGCVLAKMAAAAVLVADTDVFFNFDCLVVVLEVVDLALVGVRFYELFVKGLDGVLLLLVASVCLDTDFITKYPLPSVAIVSFFLSCLAFVWLFFCLGWSLTFLLGVESVGF